MRILLILVLLCLGVRDGVVHAEESKTLPISIIKYVYDGDTFYMDCISGYRCQNGKLGVRALDLDTPEIKGECGQEIERARAAKRFLVSLKNRSNEITVIPNHKRPYDRYGRLLAHVYFDGVNWTESMIDSGLGRVWNGSRGGWCGGVVQ